MKDVKDLFSEVEDRIYRLIESRHSLMAENLALKNEINSHQTTINKQQEIIKNLEEKIKILKLAKTLETKEGTVEAKLKINELVREIERCIGLLNT